MKIGSLRSAAMLPLIAAMALVGCDKDNSRPASAMPIQTKPAAPKAPPSTAEEKIKAIEASTLPDKEKQEAIARVRSGKL
ncbi:MAG: hypothetical protein ACO1SV_03190 [Fimbriimonas sp.]